tara:strand:+ start:105 stop:266 length:162 start_codon:yes stop_codon:yes gene_type:complete
MDNNKIICECCGEDDYTTQSYEDIKPYPEKVLVSHCTNCDLSLYKEPEPITQK